MKRMTKNEYKKYMEECANRVWTEPGYTMEKYNSDLDAVEILPLDLSKFPQLSEETIKWINIFFDEEDTDRNGEYMLRGFTRSPWKTMEKLGLSYGDYAYGDLSYWAYNNNQRLIFTYCEGDTTLKMFATQEEYDKKYASTLAWYKEEYA